MKAPIKKSDIKNNYSDIKWDVLEVIQNKAIWIIAGFKETLF